MLKYLRYFISPFNLIFAFVFFLQGEWYPTLFFLCYSLIIILGDFFLSKDDTSPIYKFPKILDFSLYLNFPLLYILVFFSIFILINNQPLWIIEAFQLYLNIDIMSIIASYTIFDKIFIVVMTSLYIGVCGTVPGHELTHRKQNKLDMFIGNWLLALSWDCAFALEHVYGHHKNVGLSTDPATGKRGENIYSFIIRAIIKEQKDAWKIENSHLKRRGHNLFSIHNKMILGYLRSLFIMIIAYIIGGLIGVGFYLLCAFISKSLLEIINFTEHYGLVRVPGEPIYPRHSWNSNNILSSVLLYNVTRHSAHHEKTNLKFWELGAYTDAPSVPYGYLSMLYIATVFPFLFHRLMVPKLIDWDNNFASTEERKIASSYNLKSGMKLLKKQIYE